MAIVATPTYPIPLLLGRAPAAGKIQPFYTYQKRWLLTAVLLLMAASVGFSQPDITFDDGRTVNACQGRFLDSGGISGAHSSSRTTRTISFCNTTIGSGDRIELNFNNIDIAGTLRFYDGSQATGTPRAVLTGASNGSQFNIRANATSPRGCITISFTPDGSTPGTGWVASFRCTQLCQEVIAVLDATDPPAVAAGGNAYIDVCPGDSITLYGSGMYPENGAVYDQRNSTSTFTWNFQNGDILTGQTVTYAYDDPGGYIIQLTVEDQRGCTNRNRIGQRVRVAPPPIFKPSVASTDYTICPGEALEIRADYEDPGADLQVTPQEVSFVTSQARTDTVFLPDGEGAVYRSALEFANFNPGQVLQSADGIVQVCANMEHSYLGDLEISLECPGGAIVDLHRYTSNAGAVNGQTLGLGDNQTETPDPGFTYCWTTSAPATIRETVINTPIRRNAPVPAGDYRPDDDFSALVGCELNGEWSIIVQDNIAVDQGYIFEWSIGFREDLYPEPERFTIPVTSVAIVDNTYYASYQPNAVTIQTPNPGPKQVVISTADSIGCSFDTTVIVTVLSPFDPACFECPDILSVNQTSDVECNGTQYQVDLPFETLPADTLTYEALLGNDISSFVHNSSSRAYRSVINVSNHEPTTVTTPEERITEVCLDIRDAGDLSDLHFVLESPDGSQVTILENFSGPGTALRRTCFTLNSSNDLSSGAPPYTGNFQPQQDFTNFTGSPTNGDWTMRVWDSGGNDVSQFLAWSISMVRDRSYTYEWMTNGATFSCTDCPNPIIQLTAPVNATLTITTPEGCTDNLELNLSASTLTLTAEATIVEEACPGSNSGSIDLSVTASTPVNYTWSNGDTGPRISGLAAQDYSVTIANQIGCDTILQFTVPGKPLIVGSGLVTNVQCYGENSGAIDYALSGGTPPFSVRWPDAGNATTENISNLSAGSYEIIVTDNAGCTFRDTLTVQQPDELIIVASGTEISCRGGNDGTATVTASGGMAPFVYEWNTGSVSAEINDLPAGVYSVTVTDANNCTREASVTIAEPSLTLVVSINNGRQGCFNSSENSAAAVADGGTGVYSYLWSNGEATAVANSLPAGPATVTVTDEQGCAATASTTISSLPEIVVTLTTIPPTCSGGADGAISASVIGGAGSLPGDYSYLWSTGDSGAGVDTLRGGVTYSVTVTDAEGCTSEASVLLADPQPISINPTVTQVTCYGDADGSIDLTTISGPNPGAYAVQWGPGAGNSTSRTIDGLGVGSYSLTVTDALGCSLETSVRLRGPDSLEQVVTQTNVSCFGQTDGMLEVTGVGGVSPYRFEWSTGATVSRVDSLVVGDYELTLTDANGCQTIDTYTVTQPGVLQAATLVRDVLCQGGNSGVVTVQTTGGTQPMEYTFETRGTLRDPVFLGLWPGTYAIEVKDANGCTTSTSATVMDGAPFSVDLGADTTLVYGDSIRLTPAIFGGADTLVYDWQVSLGTPITCLDCPNPVIYPQFQTELSLMLVDGNGCVTEDQVRLSVNKIREVAVPTGFTPNGDGRNDRLLVHGRPGTTVVSLQIYDRWANILYESSEPWGVNDPGFGWDGLHEDKLVNAGVYLYKLVVQYEDGSTETLTGQTTLIR